MPHGIALNWARRPEASVSRESQSAIITFKGFAAARALEAFSGVASVLTSNHLGPFCQLPDIQIRSSLLEDFCSSSARIPVRFRGPSSSWYTENLRVSQAQTALCLSSGKASPPTCYGGIYYARLRLGTHAKQLAPGKSAFDAWTAQGVDVYAYCKHEDAG